MRIAVASDHGGLELKDYLTDYLRELNYEIEDFGTYSTESVDYPDYAKTVCEKVLNGEADCGILVCGSGLGMSMTANRFRGIRAAVVSEPLSAMLARKHNNSNVLCLGGRLIGRGMAVEIVETYLHTSFEGGRHERRINKMDEV